MKSTRAELNRQAAKVNTINARIRATTTALIKDLMRRQPA